jgi:hypothetical protein
MYSIYIPSIERPDSEFLLELDRLKLSYYLVLAYDQVAKYSKYHSPDRIITLPKSVKGISKIRQFILDYTFKQNEKRIWMSDDDLKRFFLRSSSSNQEVTFKLFLKEAEKEILNLEKTDPTLVQVGFKYSTFAIPQSKYTLNTDIGMIQYLNIERLQNAVSYDAGMITLEDTDFSVRLIKKGFKNVKLNHFIFTAPRSGTGKGGLENAYQNQAKQKGILEFQKKFPDLIKVVDLKKGKYRIYWSKI